MLNVFTKAKPWVIASLLAITPGFSSSNNNNCQPAPKDCCVKTCPATLQAPTVAAYDAPARIDTRCSWDMWVDASFIYWQPSQDNMELAFHQTSSIVSAAVSTTGPIGNYVKQENSFVPGFKVGMGWAYDNHDNWDMAAEYTRLHKTMNQTANCSHSGTTNTPGTGYSRTWGIPNSTFDSTQLYDTVSGKWTMNLDVVDFNLGRWYYVGTDLTFRAFVGARGQWIGQVHKATYQNTGAVAATGSLATMIVKDRVHSWAVGPEIGLNTKWMLGCDFRLYGNVEADILYTDYTRLSHRESSSGMFSTWAPNLTNNHSGSVRPHMDLELGFAWGSYFDNNSWYIDLAAGYDFQVFFDQNMFNGIGDDIMRTQRLSAGNLYLQGLTITARVDF